MVREGLRHNILIKNDDKRTVLLTWHDKLNGGRCFDESELPFWKMSEAVQYIIPETDDDPVYMDYARVYICFPDKRRYEVKLVKVEENE